MNKQKKRENTFGYFFTYRYPVSLLISSYNDAEGDCIVYSGREEGERAGKRADADDTIYDKRQITMFGHIVINTALVS